MVAHFAVRQHHGSTSTRSSISRPPPLGATRRGILVLWSLPLLVVTLLMGSSHAENNTTIYNEVDCTTESAELNTDPTIEAAVDDLKTEVFTAVKEDFFSFCSIFDRSCTVNIDDYSSELQTACDDAGGQIALRSASLECDGKVLGVPIPGGVEVGFERVPACVGQSCDPDNLPQLVMDAVDTVLQEVESVVESGLQDGDCVAVVSGAANTVNRANYYWMVLTSMVVASSFLGSFELF